MSSLAPNKTWKARVYHAAITLLTLLTAVSSISLIGRILALPQGFLMASMGAAAVLFLSSPSTSIRSFLGWNLIAIAVGTLASFLPLSSITIQCIAFTCILIPMQVSNQYHPPAGATVLLASGLPFHPSNLLFFALNLLVMSNLFLIWKKFQSPPNN